MSIMFVMNPGKSKKRSNKVRSKYQSFVAKRLKKYGGGPQAMKKIGREWQQEKRGGKSNMARAKRKRRNTTHARKRTNKARHRRRRNTTTVSANPRRRHKSRRRRRRNAAQIPISYNRRRRRRSRRRNAAQIPISYNPRSSVGLMTGFESVTSADFWTGTVLPVTAGLIGTAFLSGHVKNMLGIDKKGIPSHLANIATAAALGGVVGLVMKDKKLAVTITAGGLVYSLFNIVSDLIGIGTMTGMTGLADVGHHDLSSELQDRLLTAIDEESGGVEDYLDTQEVTEGAYFEGVGEGVEDYVDAQEVEEGTYIADWEPAPGSNVI